MSFLTSRVRFLLAICIGFAFPVTCFAEVPEREKERLAVIGKVQSLQILPNEITLSGPRARVQLLVRGTYADNTSRDLTAVCSIALEPKELGSIEGGYIQAKQNGKGTVVARAGGQEIRAPVVVEDVTKPTPVSFRNEVIAALNVGGCNAGACHGTPSGKNGFRLSLRGFDPPADYHELTRDVLGRRTDRLSPEASLIWQKALGRVPHEGGQRFLPDSVPSQTILAWLQGGLRDDEPKLPTVKGITVHPGSLLMKQPARWQQLSVVAHLSDGTSRDVTRLTVFTSSDTAVATVSASGLVEFDQAGETAILCRYLESLETVQLTYLEPREGFVWSNPPEKNYVDKHVFDKLKLLNIQPSGLCTEEDFVRRAFLDVCGVLPTSEEVKQYLADKDPNKRSKLIDALLNRTEYADFWTLKWSDILRSNRKTIQVKGVHAFQQWLRGHLVANTGFDEIVHQLLTASGSTYRNPPANYYRIARGPQDLAETTAQLFFGVRMQCAKCHNHPFERWTQNDYYSLASFFARVKQKKDPREPGANAKAPGGEIIYVVRSGEVKQPRTQQTMVPSFLGVGPAKIEPGEDRRIALAEWITSETNPFFAKSVVNRVWFHLMGRGIVDPVDDFRDSNPSANDPLLEALASDFVASGFDVKKLIRTIMNSRSYQLSAVVNEFNEHDEKYFSHAVTRLLTAEQLLDALCQVTDVPEKFAGMPLGTRAVQLPDGDSSHPFLKTFGQPARELACECERESDSNLAQALQLINGPTVNGKLRHAKNRLTQLLVAKTPDEEKLTELYLTTLSRYPTEQDITVSLAHIAKAKDKRKAWEDVLWALLNTKEFLFRH